MSSHGFFLVLERLFLFEYQPVRVGGTGVEYCQISKGRSKVVKVFAVVWVCGVKSGKVTSFKGCPPFGIVPTAQCHHVNTQATTLLSNDTEADLSDTELFAQPPLSGQGGAEPSVFHSQSTSKRQSSQQQQSILPFIQTLPRGAKFGMNIGRVTRTDQKENLSAEAGCAGRTEAVPKDRAARSREEQQEGMQDDEGRLDCSNLQEMPSIEDVGRMDTVSEAAAGTPETEQQESLHDNSDLESFLSSGEELVSGK